MKAGKIKRLTQGLTDAMESGSGTGKGICKEVEI